jgi:HPt (histidine-containing phosphotransfer) domain-containing protein
LEVFNRALALERLDGDSTRLEDLLGAFQKNVPYVLEELESAWKKKDRERVENLAIELRESVRRIGAEGMEDLAARMVEAARAADFGEPVDRFPIEALIKCALAFSLFDPCRGAPPPRLSLRDSLRSPSARS